MEFDIFKMRELTRSDDGILNGIKKYVIQNLLFFQYVTKTIYN